MMSDDSSDEASPISQPRTQTRRIGELHPKEGHKGYGTLSDYWSYDAQDEAELTPEEKDKPTTKIVRFWRRYGFLLQVGGLTLFFIMGIFLFTHKSDPEHSDPVYNYISISKAHPLFYDLGVHDSLGRVALLLWIDLHTHQLLPPNHPPAEYPNPGNFTDDNSLISFQLYKQRVHWEVVEEHVESLGHLRSLGVLNDHSHHHGAISDMKTHIHFDVHGDEAADSRRWAVGIKTDSEWPIAMRMVPDISGPIVHYEVIIAAIILVGVYTLIITEVLHRTTVALAGSFIAVSVLTAIHERPGFLEIVSWIDYETVALLFGMMVMVSIFSETGFFEYCAVKAYRLTRGNNWHLVAFLCLFTGIMSLILDSVTTILLVVPVTVRLCKVINIPDPVPVVLGEIVFANLIGATTPVGDPPNVLIVNYPVIRDAVTFMSFTMHMAPGIIFATIVLLFVTKRGLLNVANSKPIDPLHDEIAVWQRALENMGHAHTEEERQVRERLVAHIAQLEEDLKNPPAPEVHSDDEEEKPMKPHGGDKHGKHGHGSDDEFEDEGTMTMEQLEKRYVVRDFPLFIKSSIVLGIVMILFFLHSFLPINMGLTWIAIIGAVALMVISGTEVEEVLEKVEFPTLFFFAGLFVLMRGLEEMGLMGFIADTSADVVTMFPEGRMRLAAAVIMLLWVGSIVSGCIDNIPYTQTLLPVVVKLSTVGLPLTPLIWSMAAGICLGGNGTLIGASANLVGAGLCTKMGHPISFNLFFQKCFPLMIVTIICETIYVLIFYVLFSWGY